MKRIILARHATPIDGQIVMPVAIEIVLPLSRTESAEEMEGDASAILNALYASLPQGTLDRLFAGMARKQASSLTLPAWRPPRRRSAPDSEGR